MADGAESQNLLSTESPYKDRFSANGARNNNRYSNQNSASRGQSSEKKSTSAMEIGRSRKNDTSTYSGVDGDGSRTAYSSEKASLIGNGPPVSDKHEETKYLMPSRMPKELRSDPEVSQKLSELEASARFYMAFDMTRLQLDMNKELEGQIQRMNKEFGEHHQEVSGKLERCEQLNQQSGVLKGDAVSMRGEKQRALREITQVNQEASEKLTKEN